MGKTWWPYPHGGHWYALNAAQVRQVYDYINQVERVPRSQRMTLAQFKQSLIRAFRLAQGDPGGDITL